MPQDNTDQIEFWNGDAASQWVSAQSALDAMLEPLSAIAIDAANVSAGERVLDIGCGCGGTSLTLAAAGASVTGVDISAPMLAHATERANAEGADARFEEGDASVATFNGDYQLLFSRFGVMFFADPTAAFANLRTALADGGRMAFLCWQSPKVNPWMSIAAAALGPFTTPPAEAPDPRAPGPFAFADPAYLREVLEGAGFADVDIQPATADLHVGDDVESAIRFLSEIGPLSRGLADMDDSTREQALTAVRTALANHLTENGLDLGAACWLVRASKG